MERDALGCTHSWSTPLPAVYDRVKYNFIATLQAVIDELTPDGVPRAEWIKNAQRRNYHDRVFSSEVIARPDDPFYTNNDGVIAEAILRGELGFAEINRLIDEAAEALTDPELPRRGMTNLGPSPGKEIRPALTVHKEICRRTIAPADRPAQP